MAALAPGALRRFKELLRASHDLTPAESLALGHRQSMELMGMSDTMEGARAFAERRAPRFEDR